MKGKKRDSEFMSDFISHCIQRGMTSVDDIINFAKQEIAKLDQQIREVDQARIRRSKILDVIEAFETPTKAHRPEEVKALSFLRIQNPKVCQYICKCLKTGVISQNALFENLVHPQADLIFGVKQLLEHKVIARTGENFVRGEQFSKYIKFMGSP